MSRDLFKLILRCLRFDDIDERNRKIAEGDKFAAMSEIWYEVINNFQVYFRPSQDITIDEQLFGTKARCKFIQYIPSKPEKFGIKNWMAVCNQSKYILNCIPYLGKDESRPENLLFGEHVVHQLIRPYENLGYKVTTDNFFTSKNLGDYLARKKTSLVGTCRKNKKFIPPLLKEKMNLYENKIVYEETGSLTAYQSKKDICVYIYSSVHKNVLVADHGKCLPDTVDYYNHSKCGVDQVGKMLADTSTKVVSRRWTVHVFYNLLNMIILNSWILYQKVNGIQMSRTNFMRKLSSELCEIDDNDDNGDERRNENGQVLKLDKRIKCGIKTNCIGNKNTNLCLKCKKPVCGSCSYCICLNCN